MRTKTSFRSRVQVREGRIRFRKVGLRGGEEDTWQRDVFGRHRGSREFPPYGKSRGIGGVGTGVDAWFSRGRKTRYRGGGFGLSVGE